MRKYFSQYDVFYTEIICIGVPERDGDWSILKMERNGSVLKYPVLQSFGTGPVMQMCEASNIHKSLTFLKVF
jgi:hypothetical protein